MGYDLAVVGNVVVDVIAPVHEELVEGRQYFTGRPIGPAIGGNAANFAVAASRLGLRVELLGAIGADPFGRWLAGQLRTAAPRLRSHLRPAKAPTSASVVIGEASGERTLLHSVGAGEAVDGSLLSEGRLRAGRWLHLCSTFLLPRLGPPAMAQLLRRAQRANMVTSVDLAWDPAGRWDLDEVPRYADLLLCNLEEGMALTGQENEGRVLQRLLDAGPEVVALKLGKGGSLIGLQNGETFHAPPFPVPVVDSTGAGDVFAAGFVGFLLQGLYPSPADRKKARPKASRGGADAGPDQLGAPPTTRRAPSPLEGLNLDQLKRAALMANAMGAMSVSGLGGVGSAPMDQEAVLAFLRRHRKAMGLFTGAAVD